VWSRYAAKSPPQTNRATPQSFTVRRAKSCPPSSWPSQRTIGVVVAVRARSKPNDCHCSLTAAADAKWTTETDRFLARSISYAILSCSPDALFFVMIGGGGGGREVWFFLSSAAESAPPSDVFRISRTRNPLASCWARVRFATTTGLPQGGKS